MRVSHCTHTILLSGRLLQQLTANAQPDYCALTLALVTNRSFFRSLRYLCLFIFRARFRIVLSKHTCMVNGLGHIASGFTPTVGVSALVNDRRDRVEMDDPAAQQSGRQEQRHATHVTQPTCPRYSGVMQCCYQRVDQGFGVDGSTQWPPTAPQQMYAPWTRFVPQHTARVQRHPPRLYGDAIETKPNRAVVTLPATRHDRYAC